MSQLKQKCPTIAGSGISKSIHLQQANNTYFNMILDNEECALFCCDVLQNFDDLLNKHIRDTPYIAPKDRLDFYIQLTMLSKEAE